MNNYNFSDQLLSFGNNSTRDKVQSWIKKWSSFQDNINFILVLAGTKTAQIEGISAAGETIDSRKYTALADGEFFIYGPTPSPKWALPSLKKGVSPALISYAASKLIKLNSQIVALGLPETPNFEYFNFEEIDYGPSNSIETGQAMSITRVNKLLDKGISFGKKIKGPIILGESVPGGTTTAEAILTGLGFSVNELVGSSMRYPPYELKKRVVAAGLSRASLDICSTTLDLLAAVGDPFQAFGLGLVIGARESNQEVLLAGGSQMIALLALVLKECNQSQINDVAKGISIATTSWLFKENKKGIDNKNSISKMLELISFSYKVDILGLVSGLNFTKSKYKEFRDYENGYVKEGVGAGALSLLSYLYGNEYSKIMNLCEEIFEAQIKSLGKYN